MNVVFISIFLSLLLVLFFITLFFFYHKKDKPFSSSEREALMPLADDTGPQTPQEKATQSEPR